MSEDIGNTNPVLKILKFDHKRICDLLFHYDQSEHPQHKLSFAQTALNELTINLTLEYELFYPHVASTHPQMATLCIQAERAYDQLDKMISELGTLPQWSELYDTRFGALADFFKNHINWQENNIYAKVTDTPMSHLAQEMIQRRDELIAQEATARRDFTPQTLLFTEAHRKAHHKKRSA